MFKGLFSGIGGLIKISAVVQLLQSKFVLGGITAYVVVIVLFASYRGYVTPFGKNTAALADHAALYVATSLPDYKESGLNPVLVIPFTGPKGAVMADLVRDAIDSTSRYDIIGKGIIEETMRSLKVDLSARDAEDARRVGKKVSAAAVITGDILQVDDAANPPILVFKAIMAEVNGDRTWKVDFPGTSGILPAPPQFSMGPWARSIAFTVLAAVAYVLAALATPLVLFPVTRNILARESNSANALMLTVYSLVDSAALFLFVNPDFSLWKWVLLAILGFVVALWLNFLSCTLVERWRK